MSTEMTLVDNGAIASLSSAEIDVQISTARRFPREVTGFRSEARQLATLNEAVAGECSYALPRDGKTIEGPSARFAEIIASAWGNCRFGARIIADDGRFITAQGYFHDLQKNTAVQFEVRRGVTTRKGFRYSDDMVATTGNAAASIALRNAVLKGVPKALWADVWEEARKCAAGDVRTVAHRRVEALKMFSSIGVKEAQVFEFLDVGGAEDIDMNHLMTLRGLITAFREGDTTPDEVFRGKAPPPMAITASQESPIPSSLDGLVQRELAKAAVAVEVEPEHPRETRSLEDAQAAPSVAHDDGAAPQGGDVTPIEAAFQLGRNQALSGLQRSYPKGTNFQYKSRAAEAEAFLKGYDEVAEAQGRMVGP